MQGQAVWFTGPHEVTTKSVEVGEPGANEVVIEAQRSAISAGTERLLFCDDVPADLPADMSLAALNGDLSYPLRYGYATVGEITRTGEDVPSTWLRERVFAFHPHQTRFTCEISDVLALDELSYEEGACLPFMETAVNLALDAQPRLGERVVVFGAGTIGLLTVTLLSAFPVEGVHVVEPSEPRRRLATDFGATTTSPSEPTDSNFDIAIEVSGNPEAFEHAVDAVGYGGRVIVGSWYGEQPVTADLGRGFHRDRVTVRSSQVSTIQPALRGRWSKERRLSVAKERLASTDVDPLISHRIPITDVAKAYELLVRPPDETHQIILEYT